MSPPDVFRSLDCWLWRLDTPTARIVSAGGHNPFGPSAGNWRAMLRLPETDGRRAVFQAIRRLRASRRDGTLRVEAIAIPAGSGQSQLVDLLLGRHVDASGCPAWTGMVARRWPSVGHPPPAVGQGVALAGDEFDAAGLGRWSLASLEEDVLLSRTAARLMGFGDRACAVPLGAWLGRPLPPDQPRLIRQMERLVSGDIERFELDLRGCNPAQPQAALRLTALRGRGKGMEMVGMVEATPSAPATASAQGSQTAPPAGTAPAGTPAGTKPGPERNTLVREIHHRIKNHLQGMTGLIERYRSDQPGIGEALDAIGSQLQSIGTVYGLLARSGRADLALDEIAQAVADGLRGIAPNGIQTRFPEGLGGWHIAEQHCVAIALVVNELLMNAIKHGGSRPGLPPVTVDCELLSGGCRLLVRNEGTLPAGFDFATNSGTRTGLQLVRALLPARGTTFMILGSGGHVEVSLLLQPPVLAPTVPVAADA